MKPEYIQVTTPLFLVAAAAIIGVSVLFAPAMSDARANAGFGLAGAALGAAGGLAHSKTFPAEKSESKNSNE